MNSYRIFEELRGSLGEEAARSLVTILEQVFEELRETVTKTDFSELKSIVAELVDAQKRTEVRVEELAEAQKRTEVRVEELAEAQKRTETRVEELAEAQKRTETRVEELAEAQKRTEVRVEELAEAQKRTETTMERGFRDLHNRFGVLGSRWGDRAEEAFRAGLLDVVGELGYSVEHYRGEDPEGFIDHSPRSYDLDVLVRDGETVAAEIKSNATRADVTEFARSVELYSRQTGRPVDRAILVAVVIQRGAPERAQELGVSVATDFSLLENR